ncbi:MAG: hypothetical protein INR65_19470 [Gluconacetobacter diazotrophicus]|nr:hypothetical protein [Gluconacetobacter diazotrophicus]
MPSLFSVAACGPLPAGTSDPAIVQGAHGPATPDPAVSSDMGPNGANGGMGGGGGVTAGGGVAVP